MDGTYDIGTDHIRALAIQCHALDVQSDRLFNSETVCGHSERIRQTHNRLLSTSLLSLAVSIRVSLAPQPEYDSPSSGITACGIFLEGKPKPKVPGFSIKDVCDKLIHADRISKPIEKGVQGATHTLIGKWNKRWEFGLGVQILCEWVLKWLDEIDERSPGVASR